MIESLHQLGLTFYEAKVLVALTKSGSGTAADIHILSGIPRSAVYGVLERLKERGMIDVQNIKPMRYKALSPNNVMDRLKKDFETECENALVQMEEIYRTSGEEEDEDLVWNISGVKNVTERILQLLNNARSEILFASSSPSLDQVAEIYPTVNSIRRVLLDKIESGVTVRILGQSRSSILDIANELSPDVDIKFYESEHPGDHIKGGILIIDDRELLITVIKEELSQDNVSITAIWSNGKELVFTFKHLIELELMASTPLPFPTEDVPSF
jgi:sugar-specific transcriptional regulator TrmB